MHYDIFNGDADGICALHQLRLAEPRPEAIRISGVKRDIVLLGRPELAEVSGSTLTVLDVSLDSNRQPLLQLLARGNAVTYFDHHSADSIPETDHLTATIVLSADTCTSLLVNEALKGKHANWAICGAFGDNLHTKARQIAASLSFSEIEISRLREIGELLNYNGYGTTLDDLHFHPLELYAAVMPYDNPLDFFVESQELVQLRTGFQEDMAMALTVTEYANSGKNRVYFFPDAPWGRRITGVFANLKAREKTDSAHALIAENRDSTLRISVRAPLNDRRDAATLCKMFPAGGGRAASAGINYLPTDQLEDFLTAFNKMYP